VRLGSGASAFGTDQRNPHAPHEKKSLISLAMLVWGIHWPCGLPHVGQTARGGDGGSPRVGTLGGTL
jgi:hypothetical protein